MTTKEAEAGAPPSNPRALSHFRDIISIEGEDKRVSEQAVKSVAGQYGIDASLFRDWLARRGFEIREEA